MNFCYSGNKVEMVYGLETSNKYSLQKTIKKSYRGFGYVAPLRDILAVFFVGHANSLFGNHLTNH